MKKVIAQTMPVNVEVEISVEEMIRALKAECGVYESHDSHYTVEYYARNNVQLVKHTDVSYHGSPIYKDTVVSTDKNVINMFEAITVFERAYNEFKSMSKKNIVSE